jgi:hypothetical protein
MLIKVILRSWDQDDELVETELVTYIAQNLPRFEDAIRLKITKTDVDGEKVTTDTRYNVHDVIYTVTAVEDGVGKEEPIIGLIVEEAE